MSKYNNGRTEFEIYSTCEGGIPGLVHVSEPLHRDIMAALRERNMSTTEISEALGKAQSTLSIHLDTLVNKGLIRSEPDPRDSRRKIFSISCTEVAYSKDCSKEGIEETKKILTNALDAKEEFFKFILRAFVLNSDAKGLSLGPAAKYTGKLVGDAICSKNEFGTIEDAIDWLQEFYEKATMGEVCVYTFAPLTFIIRDDYDFGYKFDSISMFSQGIFERVLSYATGKNFKVTKSEIFGTGNNYYKFVMEPYAPSQN